MIQPMNYHELSETLDIMINDWHKSQAEIAKHLKTIQTMKRQLSQQDEQIKHLEDRLQNSHVDHIVTLEAINMVIDTCLIEHLSHHEKNVRLAGVKAVIRRNVGDMRKLPRLGGQLEDVNDIPF